MNTPQLIVILVALLLALWIAGRAIFSVTARRRNPAIGTCIECDGVRLHYVERGSQDDPVLVLLHGNGTMVQHFIISGVVSAAAARYRVLCFDRPGFGQSMRPRRRIWTRSAGRILRRGIGSARRTPCSR